MTEDKRFKGHCPACGADRWADVKAHIQEKSEGAYFYQTDFRILQCRGCERIYFQTVEVSEEDITPVLDEQTGEASWEHLPTITHWPLPWKRDRPLWLTSLYFEDFNLGRLLSDVYTAIDNDLDVLAAIGIRTTFDWASELLKVDPHLFFAKKLEKLVDAGRIGLSEKEALDSLTNAGSAAAHRGWRPDKKQLGTMMDILEGFIHREFIVGPEAKKLKADVPKRH